jgi:hypothetical protein
MPDPSVPVPNDEDIDLFPDPVPSTNKDPLTHIPGPNNNNYERRVQYVRDKRSRLDMKAARKTVMSEKERERWKKRGEIKAARIVDLSPALRLTNRPREVESEDETALRVQARGRRVVRTEWERP